VCVNSTLCDSVEQIAQIQPATRAIDNSLALQRRVKWNKIAVVSEFQTLPRLPSAVGTTEFSRTQCVAQHLSAFRK